MQLQTMNEMMKGQFDEYPISSVMILGIAGGNGLEHIQKTNLKDKFKRVYGVDVNPSYLKEVNNRYLGLDGILECLCINLIDEADKLPEADMVMFDGLEQVHHQMDEHLLKKAMIEIDYHATKTLERMLPNGKKLVQIDFER